MSYSSYHNHSDYSNLVIADSPLKVSSFVEKVKSMGGNVACLTEHGSVAGFMELVHACEDADIFPVFGIEAYKKEDLGNKSSSRLHMVMLAKDEIGIKAITGLISDANKRIETVGKSNFPCVNDELLMQYIGKGSAGYGHVIVTSACIGGIISGLSFDIAKKQKRREVLLEKITTHENAEKTIADIESKIAEIDKSIEQLTPVSKRTFTKAIKNAQGDAARLAEIAKEEDEKQAAINMLASLKDEKKSLKKQITEEKKNLLPKNSTITGDVSNNQEVNVKKIKGKAETYAEYELLKDVPEDVSAISKLMYDEALRYNEMFGSGNFFIELQYHGYEEEKIYMPILARIAAKAKIPVSASNDAHMANKADLETRMVIVSTRNNLYEEARPGDEELYMKDDDELREWLSKILPIEIVNIAIENSAKILDVCKLSILNKSTHYPKYDNSLTAEETQSLLREKAKAGLLQKYPVWTDELEQRFNYELDIICSMGYADYFLIVEDFLTVGRKLGRISESSFNYLQKNVKSISLEEFNNIVNGPAVREGLTIGPGRGSGAGSIVCYGLGITSIDPIKFGLIFERFLNPERVSMPDIDSDMAKCVREIIIEYVKKKYGSDAVVGIMTKGILAGKSAIKGAGRIYGSTLDSSRTKEIQDLAQEMANKIPTIPNATIVDNGDELIRFIDSDDKSAIYNQAKNIEGTYIQCGSHAAGVVIGNEPIKNFCPIMYDPANDLWKTQYDMVEVEANGMLKMDFLGLINLDVVTDALRLIKSRKNIVLDVERLCYDVDAKVMRTFQLGDTTSVFQFESSGMKNMLKRFKPDSFEDLILLVSMFRPGPMQYLDDVIAVKNGTKKMEFLCSALEPILSKTYGAIIYQGATCS